MLVEGREVNFLITTIEVDNFADECLEVVIEAFKQLDSLELPHFFNLDVIKVTRTYLDRLLLSNSATDCDSIGRRRFLGLEIALEHHYVELTIVCLGHLDKKLDSTHLLPLNIEDGAKVRYTEWLGFDARQQLFRPQRRAIRLWALRDAFNL